MDEFAIVIICYNRPKSLIRLLNSLSNIKVNNEEVTLYISIDNAKSLNEDNEKVKLIANNYTWNFGKKIVDIKKDNLGLKNHVIECGKLTDKYMNIIVLEDDLLVSPVIFEYAKQVVKFYNNEDNIAGYGLYSYPKNQYSNRLFVPLNDGTDVYFMQNACSWGQIWTRKQWQEFYNWYEENKNKEFTTKLIPKEVCQWDDKSWLKWHIKYVIQKNKFFVYPHTSITTNFSEKGVHNSSESFGYQSNLYTKNDKEIIFRFEKLEQSKSIYDAYYENIRINEFINLKEQICSDFYNTKELSNIKENYQYLLTCKKMNYRVIKKYKLEMYPYEQNIINNIEGQDIFLYNLHKKEKNKYKSNKIKNLIYSYRIAELSFKDILLIKKLINKKLLNKIKNKITWRKND